VSVDLWCSPEPAEFDAVLAERYAALLSSDEQARWQRFAMAADSRRFLLARALVRTVLGEYRGVAPKELEFSVDHWGKPHLLSMPEGEGPLHFNLSHTHGMAVLAVSRQVSVGVDVEDATRAVGAEALTARYFAPEELRELKALPESERQGHFLRLWTLKEAYVKALGLGLRIPLDGFAFALRGREIAFLRRDGIGAGESMCLRSLALPPHHRVGLVALTADEFELRVCEGLPLRGFAPLTVSGALELPLADFRP
jgi:4'-phosphopantetheinyl transferase